MKFPLLAIYSLIMVSYCCSFPLKTTNSCSADTFQKTLQLMLKVSEVIEDYNKDDRDQNSSESNSFKPANCADIQLMGNKKNGIYEIFSRGTQQIKFKVYCDLITDGGGWTVFQRRGDFGDPKENFYRPWKDYRLGFGNMQKEFWLGNDFLSILTLQDRLTLKVELEDFSNISVYAQYSNFIVDGEELAYKMNLSSYRGNAGDSLSYHNNFKFATYDRDNANLCASKVKGGWWYNNCHYSNLNGLYFKSTDKPNNTCTNWYHVKSDWRCMKTTEMKLRPEYFLNQKKKKK